jgi:hypothetical protein
MQTTTIKLKCYMYWAECKCGHSMRIPSPNNLKDRVKIPVFCCGCGKRIIYIGEHPRVDCLPSIKAKETKDDIR